MTSKNHYATLGVAPTATPDQIKRAYRKLARGEDQHAVILIELADAYRGATRTLSLQIPSFDSRGVLGFSDRQLQVPVPKGVREGQHLRLKGQGEAGQGGAPAGDLYLEVAFMPHPPFRLDARDVYVDLPVAPWEAALGATVMVVTPESKVQLTIPPGSPARRRLRLKGLGLPGSPPGDFYAVLDIALPPDDDASAQQASAFPDYQPRG